MATLLDARGEGAVIGVSLGFWLGEADFVTTADLSARSLGALGFPRDWPNVYTTSKVLKSLIGKKGRCAGKRVAVVGAPEPEERAQVQKLRLPQLQSFSNAERVEQATGLQIVRGWAVYEHLDLAISAAFVAERYWWNTLPDGKWVDFTPRPEGWPDLLLAEAAGDASKQQAVLSAVEFDFACALFKQRFALTLAPAAAPAPAMQQPKRAVAEEPVSASAAAPAGGAAAAARKREPATASATSAAIKEAAKAAAAAAPKEMKEDGASAAPPGSLRAVLARVRAGEQQALGDLEEKLKADATLCVSVVGDSSAIAKLVAMLPSSREEVLTVLLQLTDAGVEQKKEEIGSGVIDGGAVPPLVELLASRDAKLQELSAAVLGNLCHESPANQERVATKGVFQPLVDLLSEDLKVAQEAAYAIWNLTVGHEGNSAKFAACGAVSKLATLLKSHSDIAQENAAGALMHVTMSPAAREAIVHADAIPRLCELLKATFEPEVSTQAAGALLNLASDSTTHVQMIVKAGAVGPLVHLVKDGPDLAKEYAAGALMNLTRGDMEVAEKASKEGAIPALAALLSRPKGHSEALGTLANIASGSPDRQIAIYKAQVTRKTVTFLSSEDLDTRRSAAALLMNMSPQAKIKERIVEAGALKPLAAVLKDSDDAVKERAAGALANLFNDASANVHSGFKQAPEMIPSLVALLQVESASTDAKRQAAHALAMLAAEDGPCDAVWSAGAGKPLCALLRTSVPEAALGIMNLSWRWPEVKQELAKDSAIDDLMRMLRAKDAMAKEYAAGALMNLTAGSSENAESAAGAVAALVDMLKTGGAQASSQAAEWSAGALANLVRAGCKARKAAIDGGAAPLLAALLAEASVNGRTLPVLALTALAEGPGHIGAVQKALGGPKEKAKLRDFRDNGSEELREHTKALAETLGPNFF